MQAIDINGMRREVLPYNEKVMKDLLNDPDIKEVRVFNIVRGDEVEVMGKKYKVLSVSKSGGVHMQEIKS